MSNYEKCMRQCFKLALKADGKTAPNPLVGCVVLDKNDKIIAKGYHHKCGMAHAERDALNKLKNNEAEGGTLIVNLEPCSHFGKTPPCADLIIEKKLKKVVIGIGDSNPKVAGGGIRKLKNAGIEVVLGVLSDEAKQLNEVFFKNQDEKKCFVAIKSATTLDGKIATSVGDSKWITSENAREEVQKIRNRYDAIMTSSETVIKDNPSLTCRCKGGKNPIRIVVDRTLKTDFASKVYNDDGVKVYVITSKNVKEKELPKNVEAIKCKEYNNKIDLEEAFDKLYKKGIMSVLVEAGGKLSGDILDKNLADKIYQFIAPKVLADSTGKSVFEGRNIKKISNTINFKFESITDYSPDILVIYTRLV